MKINTEKKIAALKVRPREALKDEWERLYRRKPPRKISRNLLVRSIAHKYQEEAYGGLKPEARVELERLIRAYRADPAKPVKHKIRLKPGTRLIRSWKGKPHEVIASENGFVYQGRPYKSLTEVAGKITGSHWSGLAFFGLNKSGKPAKVEAA
jgi:hypothetical protein